MTEPLPSADSPRASASNVPATLQPDLSLEMLQELLQQGHESTMLDYKRSCDLSNTGELVEIVKDIAAMQVHGGYIILGADDNGNITAGVESTHIRMFEQASLNAKIQKYLDPPFDVRAKAHIIDEQNLILIYIGRHPDGFAVLARAGNNTRNEVVFRAGDVFVRHGTASERWNQADIAAIRHGLLEREKERWTKELIPVVPALAPTEQVRAVEAGPAKALSFYLDQETFEDVLVEQVRQGDLVPLKLLLSHTRAEVGELLSHSSSLERLELVLDRLVLIAALGLRLEDDGVLARALHAMDDVYNFPVGSNGLDKPNLDIKSTLLWFSILKRIAGLGAYALRLERWDVLRSIVLQRVRGYDAADNPNWYRHALTMTSRDNIMTTEMYGGLLSTSFLRYAQTDVERLDCLRPDLLSDEEAILDSLCQFDVMACLIGIDDAGRIDHSAYYPSFSKYYSSRSVPAFVQVVSNHAARENIFRGSDEKLAEAIRTLEAEARNEGFLNWDGIREQAVTQFLERHLPPN